MSRRLLYFAYGSNMLVRRLAAPERAPSASAVGIARLSGYEMRFHKRSNVDGSAKCGITPVGDDGAVFGVLYEIDPLELPALDAAEGVGSGYLRCAVEPSLVSSQTPLRSFTYVSQPGHVDDALSPFGWYKALVIAGALEHGLPSWYRRQIEAVEAIADPVRARAKRFRRIVERR